MLPNFGNFLKKSSGIKCLQKKITVWKRLGKVAPGRVREGDGVLVGMVRLGKFQLFLLVIYSNKILK
jgi:hypothetical protein